MIKKNNLVLAVIFISLLAGCSTRNMFATEVYVSPEIVEEMSEAQTFIGQTKQDVFSRYGEPKDIRYNVLRNYPGRKDNAYDEVWYYKYDAGVPLLSPNQYSIEFYFIGNVVKLVTG